MLPRVFLSDIHRVVSEVPVDDAVVIVFHPGELELVRSRGIDLVLRPRTEAAARCLRTIFGCVERGSGRADVCIRIAKWPAAAPLKPGWHA